jgi:hypothetical protein
MDQMEPESAYAIDHGAYPPSTHHQQYPQHPQQHHGPTYGRSGPPPPAQQQWGQGQGYGAGDGDARSYHGANSPPYGPPQAHAPQAAYPMHPAQYQHPHPQQPHPQHQSMPQHAHSAQYHQQHYPMTQSHAQQPAYSSPTQHQQLQPQQQVNSANAGHESQRFGSDSSNYYESGSDAFVPGAGAKQPRHQQPPQTDVARAGNGAEDSATDQSAQMTMQLLQQLIRQQPNLDSVVVAGGSGGGSSDHAHASVADAKPVADAGLEALSPAELIIALSQMKFS